MLQNVCFVLQALYLNTYNFLQSTQREDFNSHVSLEHYAWQVLYTWIKEQAYCLWRIFNREYIAYIIAASSNLITPPRFVMHTIIWWITKSHTFSTGLSRRNRESLSRHVRIIEGEAESSQMNGYLISLGFDASYRSSCAPTTSGLDPEVHRLWAHNLHVFERARPPLAQSSLLTFYCSMQQFWKPFVMSYMAKLVLFTFSCIWFRACWLRVEREGSTYVITLLSVGKLKFKH